ncbi:lipase [Rhizobacter sp. AJA081-3]|uniref:SGNH/GDSL hydrolase family protein n=1 Tax=Rhizobacter sp. AJA081-3 TaxID=2753607 RepID=UPI001ADF6675|nr:SGNH/GDSL hydrolase family protein [Rhizobacter sp. AJA081-3]QTN22299.1 lipase [Rhizobacter sp. AJA081-3]
MKLIRNLAPLALSALLLAACGGGDPYVPGSGSPAGAPTSKGNFTAIVSFGTSPSDLGTYTPATAIPNIGTIGGKFTTNSATGTVWVENFAASIGVIITPAEVGFNGQSVKCPAAANPALVRTCTGYAQGGARVTDPNGVGHDPVSGLGALTVPVTQQIDNHLANPTFGGRFSDTDLIFVEGGLNDLFVQMQIFGAAAGQIQAQAGSGAISVDEANRQLFAAQTAAQEAMKTAALELAAAVRTKILAHGGKYVAVATIPDLANTPFGNSPAVAPARSVLIALSSTFNVWLREGLTNQPVKILDLYNFFNAVVASPTTYGMDNVTTPACDVAKISTITGGQAATGSSLFCNSTPNVIYNTLLTTPTAANDTTWLFADDVHPTKGGHKLLSDIATQQLQAFGWI